MKNIFKIYKRDIVTISTNWAALIMILILIIVPSLYSLINIKASWDPYGSTSGLKVAIINEDEGTIFKEKDINIGEELVEKLKENNKLGWTFVDKETGKKGLLEEKYYATIEIPQGFSEDITTITSKNVVKPKLIYTVNEKKNTIAPKITDSGVNTLKGQIDDNVVKTVSGIMFRLFNQVGLDIEENRSELRKIIDTIYELDENMPKLKTLLDDTIQGTTSTSQLLQKAEEMVPIVSDTVDSSGEFLNISQEYLDQIEGDFSDISPLIKENLVMAEDALDASGVVLGNIDENILPDAAKKGYIVISDSADALKKITKTTKSQLKNLKSYIDKIKDVEINLKQPKADDSEEALKAIESANKQLKYLQDIQDKLNEVSKKISNTIDKLNTIDERLDLVIDKINEEIKQINIDGSLNIESLKNIRQILDDIHFLVTNLVEDYDSQLVPATEEGFKSIREICDSGLVLLEQGKSILPDVEKLLEDVTETSNLSNEQLVKLKDDFPNIEEKVHKIAYKLRGVDEENQIDELLEMITNEWDTQSSFMSSPVEIEDNRMFPWPNYGSTATPFYTILCLWVGGLLSSALLSLEAKELEEGVPIKSYEIYLGKLLTFLTLAIFQALVASTGALIILGSYTLHPVMYVFYSVFVSIVFMTMIYTAGSILDDVGKAIIVVILVLQMAATSGNFPIEVTPVLFQKLSPYLPFTYAINGMRQIMAGIVYPILFKDIIILCVYMIVSLIAGLLLKSLFSKSTTKLMGKLSESGILRH